MTPRPTLLAASARGLLAARAGAVVLPEATALQKKAIRHPDLFIPGSPQPLADLSALAARLEGELADMRIAPAHGFYDARAGRWQTLILSEPLLPGSGVDNTLRWAKKPAGASTTVTLDVTVDRLPGPTLGNTATVIGQQPDPVAANNSEIEVTTVAGLGYFTVPPCRVVDTRGGAPIGGPALEGQATRVFAIAGHCGISATAKSLSLNVTVTQPVAAGNIRLFPAGSAPPLVSTINYASGQTRGNNAIVPLAEGGQIAAFAGQTAGTTVHVILDVNGYFE